MKLLSFWTFLDSLLPGLPFLILAIGLYCFYRAYQQWKSGSKGWIWDGYTPKWVESDKRVSYWSIGTTTFGIILTLAAIAIFIIMQSDK